MCVILVLVYTEEIAQDIEFQAKHVSNINPLDKKIIMLRKHLHYDTFQGG